MHAGEGYDYPTPRGKILIARGVTPGIKKKQICFGAIFDDDPYKCREIIVPKHKRIKYNRI